jgi:hypothetical protein
LPTCCHRYIVTRRPTRLAASITTRQDVGQPMQPLPSALEACLRPFLEEFLGVFFPCKGPRTYVIYLGKVPIRSSLLYIYLLMSFLYIFLPIFVVKHSKVSLWRFISHLAQLFVFIRYGLRRRSGAGASGGQAGATKGRCLVATMRCRAATARGGCGGVVATILWQY